MMKIEQRGTLAGLAMIGLAVAWMVLDDSTGEGENVATVPGSTQELTSSSSNREPVYYARSEAYSSERENRDIGSLRGNSKNERPQHRVVQRGTAALNDATLLNNSPTSTNKRPAKRTLTERESLRALRLGASNSGSIISLEEALAAIDPEAEVEIPVTTSQRAEAIRALALQDMDNNQLEAVYEFIEEGAPSEGMTDSTYRWLSDELFTALRNQEHIPTDLVPRLTEIVSNPEQDAVLRDYALQHLGHYHEQGANNNLEAIEQTLWTATDIKEGTIAGTALIALSNAKTEDRMVTNYNLEEKAIVILNGNYTEESKISALESLKGNQSAELAELVQNLATSEDTPTALKIKAQKYK